MITTRIASIGLAALIAGASAASACTVTKAGYDALRDGMSIAQAESVLGCKGEEISSSNFSGIVTVMLIWEGDGFGANMNAMFQNNALISKAQLGLE